VFRIAGTWWWLRSLADCKAVDFGDCGFIDCYMAITATVGWADVTTVTTV